MRTIYFIHEAWLPVVFAAVIIVLMAGMLWLRRRKRLVRFYKTSPGRIYGHFRVSFYVLFLALLCFGLGLLVCEPYLKEVIPTDVYEPLHIVMVMDISKSMLVPASDDQSEFASTLAIEKPCAPTRLDVAAHEIRRFIDIIEEQGTDKVALVVFARYAYPAIAVITDDYQLFKRRFEKETEIDNVLTMAEGSNQWYAVERALPVFRPEKHYRRLLIILTDGEPTAPANEISVSRTNALAGMNKLGGMEVYVVGIGEPGVRRPVYVEWVQDGCPDTQWGYMVQTAGPDAGRIITTVTDTVSLRAFADDLGGRYVHSTTGSDLSEKLREIITKERVRIGIKYSTKYVDISRHITAVLLGMLVVLILMKTP